MEDGGHRWLNQHRSGQRLPKAVGGEGVHVIDETGKRYLDGSSGPALFCLGHGHREVIEAIKAQYDRLAFGYSANFTSEPIDALAEAILEQAGGGMSRVSFVSGGSEATETAMKIALQYHVARGHSGRTHFFARRQSWHGYTFGALALSGHPARRKPYAGALMEVTHLSPANAYRPPAGVAEADLAEHLAREFEREIHRIGAERIAALFFEPVVGAAGGAVPAPEGYAARMREICSRYGILMVADEVMCGVGRCGTWRALAHDGVAPDIMYTAKGLAGGYAPLGAALMTEEVYRTIADTFGTVASVHTYSGHTAACAAGLAVQRVIQRDGLVDKCRSDGDYLMGALREAFGQNPHVGDIRGRGFFVALEYVRDRETKAPFAPELGLQAKVKEEAFARGLLCYPSPGTVDGYNGDHVILAPPYIISRAEIDRMVDLLKQATAAALSRIAR
ncbi:aspartate aminotransferase family protein [Phreatobacter sp. AB_2022a]|uniref:aspartate aminotransferase family protein n=1 Tax=Phreatobacter sp. AB_2022a TaxID=3003134 RepID=UPI002286D76A|nr:aspartate aminotransferase family protein [Phreatobacter sp. AB_2022a]MCZ0733060.1 aspartate aminotransferase family protein [Phreatobacter sp. AB_2022a]